MRHILRRHEIVPDDWYQFGEDAPEDGALIVPLAELRRDPQRWRARPGKLGVRLSADVSCEDLTDDLPRLDLVAVEFPNPGDGRGYSLARLLRDAAGFRGELRAVGAGVRQDQVFLMNRCGFDSLELAAGEDPEAARRALRRYDVAYQAGSAAASPVVTIRAQRFS